MEYVVNKVKDLQAALFPVQPIPGNAIAGPCLQTRFGGERKDLDSVLSLTSGFVRCRETKESFQTLLVDSHFIGLDSVSLESRWPTECQVLADKIRHLEYNPVEPEPFYVPTGKEPKPKPIGEESGTVLFHYCPTGVTNYFSRSCIGGSAVSIPDTIERTADCVTRSSATDLCFESRFESGNLGKVIKITDTFYELHLRNDLYTQRHTQWYYFRISNTKSGTMYRLSIVNLWKENSLYNEGLKPLLYSTKDATARSIGWRRCGENIIYYKNDSSDDRKEKHTLTFNIYFPHDQDTVYLAYCYPYTYTDLQEYLIKIANDSIKSRFTKLRMLCRSLAGNAIYYLTITAPSINDETQRKKGVVITARVHPGETPSSWIMKGIIDFLTGESNQAKELRERFIFKLVPMLNPDGVIVGNNRCSLSGVDLNRQYRTVIRESYPAVWHTKLMIRRLMEECGIALYCDLHAHSRKHNVFIYGCENKRAGCIGTLAEQVFPLMLHKNAADKFSFESCKFHIEKSKEGTGRVVVWLMGIQNSYTLEASLGGSKLGSRSGTHFSTQDYEQTGKAFCETLLDFSDNDPIKENLRNKILSRLAKEGSSADEPTNIDLTDYSSDEGDTSDSLSENDEKYDEEMLKRSGLYIEDPRYLCVPPTSSVLLKPATIDPIRKTKKPKGNLSKNVLSRKKLMQNRKAMDLPRTDPGSDLYELSDSDDETNVRSATKMKSKSSDEDAQFSGKENQQKIESDLSFPLIVRPRSLSLGEEIISEDLTRINKRRLRHRRMPRTLRNLSPLMQRSQHVQMKLLTLRRQVWTGVGNLKLENEKDKLSLTNNYPLSWGVPKMPYEHQTNDEVSIEPCSKKLDELSSGKSDLKKQKKKVRKKSTKIIDVPSEVNHLEEENRQTKKKKPRVKRHKVVKSSLEPLDNNTIMVTSDGLDSLKLCGTAKLPKILSKHKTDSRRKLNKLIGSAAITAAKSNVKTHADSVGDSSSAENSPVVIRRKSIKKKYNSSTGKKLMPSVIIAKKNTK